MYEYTQDETWMTCNPGNHNSIVLEEHESEQGDGNTEWICLSVLHFNNERTA